MPPVGDICRLLPGCDVLGKGLRGVGECRGGGVGDEGGGCLRNMKVESYK